MRLVTVSRRLTRPPPRRPSASPARRRRNPPHGRRAPPGGRPPRSRPRTRPWPPAVGRPQVTRRPPAAARQRTASRQRAGPLGMSPVPQPPGPGPAGRPSATRSTRRPGPLPKARRPPRGRPRHGVDRRSLAGDPRSGQAGAQGGLDPARQRDRRLGQRRRPDPAVRQGRRGEGLHRQRLRPGSRPGAAGHVRHCGADQDRGRARQSRRPGRIGRLLRTGRRPWGRADTPGRAAGPTAAGSRASRRRTAGRRLVMRSRPGGSSHPPGRRMTSPRIQDQTTARGGQAGQRLADRHGPHRARARRHGHRGTRQLANPAATQPRPADRRCDSVAGPWQA